jgi:methionyl-tRNA formyltransferase
MGTPGFAAQSLEALCREGLEIAAVVTAPDKPTGRGLKVTESEVKKRAVLEGIRVLQPDSLQDPLFVEELEKINADIFVVVAFRMLPEIVWSLPRLGTFNLHASLLPDYRGAAPINWAIINGEEKTGVTTFLIDHNIDTGQILFSQETSIDPEDNAGSLHDKLMTTGASLVVKTVYSLLSGDISPIDQNLIVTNKKGLSTAPKLNRNLCEIDWKKEALTIHNLIRGLSPYPAAFSTMTNGQKSFMVKIFGSQITAGKSDLMPGQLETDGKNYLRVGTSKGSLLITSLQAAGKKRLGIKEFLAGMRDVGTYSFTHQ